MNLRTPKMAKVELRTVATITGGRSLLVEVPRLSSVDLHPCSGPAIRAVHFFSSGDRTDGKAGARMKDITASCWCASPKRHQLLFASSAKLSTARDGGTLLRVVIVSGFAGQNRDQRNLYEEVLRVVGTTRTHSFTSPFSRRAARYFCTSSLCRQPATSKVARTLWPVFT